MSLAEKIGYAILESSRMECEIELENGEVINRYSILDLNMDTLNFKLSKDKITIKNIELENHHFEF